MFPFAVLCLAVMLLIPIGSLAGEVASVDSITITTVYDNEVFAKDLTPSWGFSCLVQGLEKTILFDTGGDGEILLDNMEQLGLDPQEVQVVVLSHLHGDHTGGLTDFLRVNPRVTVYLPDAFPDHLKREVIKGNAQLMTVQEPVEICPGVFLTGEMGMAIPEQALILQTAKGLVVITGCAHPGITQMIAKSQQVRKGPLHLVMGGFHLFGASRQRVREILGQFRDLGVAKVSPCHCTGTEASEMFQETYSKDYIQCGVGQVIHLQR